MTMIDFTNCPIRNKTYAGANGNKISILFNDEVWMLKFPSPAKLNDDLSYANGCVSEYLGCHIFNMLGVDAQETLLGTYNKYGKEKIVVACKDFAVGGLVLQDFASLKNTIIDSSGQGYGTELDDVLTSINDQNKIDASFLLEHFWNMFIIDALIGNWDRHNGNWGFLYDEISDSICLAPIFDCGSSLYPQADESLMQKIMSDNNELSARIFDRPTSSLKIKNKRINYFDFISSLENDDCNKALKRICKRIDLNDIYTLIDETLFLTEIQNLFYKRMIKERKEKILDYSYSKLEKIER